MTDTSHRGFGRHSLKGVWHVQVRIGVTLGIQGIRRLFSLNLALVVILVRHSEPIGGRIGAVNEVVFRGESRGKTASLERLDNGLCFLPDHLP